MKENNLKTFTYIDQNDFDVSQYKNEMTKHGVFLAQFEKEIDVLSLIHKVGKPHSHNGNNAYVWDIKPKPGESSETVARSQTMEEFVFHTDCSFEVPPPPYVALYVIHPDRFGGGISKMIDIDDILSLLDRRTKDLLAHDVKVKIPKEFMKDREYSTGPILFKGNRIAYRRECIIESELSAEHIQALDALDAQIANPACVTSVSLPRGSVLFLDNTRFLHARTEIKDEKRHLQRVRYF
ncbi:MAG: TauD/TfdA family dioxygenase [Patescibacteria group bacterium]